MKRILTFEGCEERLPLTGVANVDTPADVIHPNIHDKVGQGAGENANANPNGANANGGQIHGIANVPGKGGDHPGGAGGFAQDLATVHGGIDAVNQNA